MKHKTALILSDLHYGDLAHLKNFGKKGGATDEELHEIAESIVFGLIQERQIINYIFVLGDLTSRGSPGEFQDVYRFLLILRKLLNIDQSKVFITYGNHDVDWKICQLETRNPEHEQAYRVTAANLGGSFAPTGEITFEGPVLGSGVTHLEGIDLISLNSGIECYNDQSIKHGKLGIEQFNWLQNDLKKHLRCNSTKIVILHHHLFPLPYPTPVHDLSALEEGPKVLEILGRYGIDLVLHGHRHHPLAHTAINSNWAKPITFFCAGSFGVVASERASGRLPNTIHTICIDAFSGNKSFDCFVNSYELNSSLQWIPLVPNPDEYPINQKQWIGSPNATEQADHDIETILITANCSLNSEAYAELPLYEDLPLSLKCVFHITLNSLLQSKAKSLGIKITGDYPKNCLATREGQ